MFSPNSSKNKNTYSLKFPVTKNDPLCDESVTRGTKNFAEIEISMWYSNQE